MLEPGTRVATTNTSCAAYSIALPLLFRLVVGTTGCRGRR
jgi:hypothetical protein